MSQSPAVYDPTKDPSAMAQNSAQVGHILATVASKNDQIDAICEARGWKEVNTELRDILDVYLDGNLSANRTLDVLASPIKASYSSADQGYRLWETERTARCFRPFFTAEKSLELWGEPRAPRRDDRMALTRSHRAETMRRRESRL